MAIANWISLSQSAGTSGTTVVTITATTYDELTARTTNFTVSTVNTHLSETVNILQNGLDYDTTYLTFQILSGGTISWYSTSSANTKTVEYRINGGNWNSITSSTGGTEFTANTGDIIEWRGDNAAYGKSDGHYNLDWNGFAGTDCQFNVYGNIMSLINSTAFSAATTLQSAYTFNDLFNGCTGLIDASNLKLPATALTEGCYWDMFVDCIDLTATPTLPATTLANYCYCAMFGGCISLTTLPALPATTLYEGCYQSMFVGCSSLTTIPSNYLPATTLADYCYIYMFANCTGLTTIPSNLLPATALTVSCYEHLFGGCYSLTTVPSNLLPATTLANRCYYGLFWGCENLTSAPTLPATTLVDNCYYDMFDGCSRLNYIKCLATDISAPNCTKQWVRDVANSGTFVKDDDMEDWGTGQDDIPTGWTVQDAPISGITFLDGLYFTGASYVDTGILPDLNTRVEMYGVTVTQQQSYFPLFGGCNNDESGNWFRVRTQSSATVLKGAVGNAGSQITITYPISGTVTLDKTSLEYNNQSVAINATSMNQSTSHIYIHTDNRNGVPTDTREITMGLKQFKIFKNNQLVCNLKAAKDENNIVCLYDKVNGNCHYNIGTGGLIEQ